METAKGSSPKLSVPEYDLYGDKPSSRQFRFAHVERLEDRNAVRHWRIDRHRHPYLHQVSLVLSGGCEYTLDGCTYQSTGSSVVYIKAGVVHEFAYQPGSEGYIFTCSLDFMQEIRRLDLGAFDFQNELLKQNGRPIISAEFSELIDRICQILCVYSSPPENGYLDEIVLHQAYFWKVLKRAVDLSPAGNIIHANSDHDLFERFKRLLRKSLALEDGDTLPVCNARTVEYFAGHLGATPYRLNRCCEGFEGRSAKKIIKDAVVAEATRLLLYSNHTVKEISVFLGYSNPSHFIRFFSQHRGTTPSQFRAMHSAPERAT